MSGIALFDEPPRVSIMNMEGLLNGLLLGILSGEAGLGVAGVVLTEDGSVTVLPVSTFVLDWRYSAETDQWIDVSMPKPDQTDIAT